MEITAKEIERFMKKIAASDGNSECWVWTAGTDTHGYGKFSRERDAGHQRKVGAHRFSYELFIGSIPEGLELDHLCHTNDLSCPGNKCRHRLCVNPRHLEPVPHLENVNRGRAPTARGPLLFRTHCARGHLLTDDNTYASPDGRQRCRTCMREQDRLRDRSGRVRSKPPPTEPT